MIVIFGFRVRLKTIAEGTFFCPRCGADRSYLLQQARRWFTLFFIPIFPTSKPLGDQVQCTTCHTNFRPEVLDVPTSEEFSENLRGAMRVAAIAMLKASDPHHAAARHAAISAARETGLEHYEDAWLANDLDAIDTSTLDNYMRSLATGLNDQGKETFVAKVARDRHRRRPAHSSRDRAPRLDRRRARPQRRARPRHSRHDDGITGSGRDSELSLARRASRGRRRSPGSGR